MNHRERLTLVNRDLVVFAQAVVNAHFVSLDTVLSSNRTRVVSEARAHLCYELYDLLGSYPAVGEVLGLDHTSVMAGRERWARVVGDIGMLSPRNRGPRAA